MPAVPKTSREELIDAALDIVEREGLEALTFARLAREVGIRSPSLYSHFASRKDLLIAIEDRLFCEVTQRFLAVDEEDPRSALRRMCFAFRDFALERPNCYQLMFALDEADAPHANEVRRRAIQPTMRHLTTLYGKEAFLRNRAMVGFLHGFVTLEILHGFRLGTQTVLSFALGVDLILGFHEGKPPKPRKTVRRLKPLLPQTPPSATE